MKAKFLIIALLIITGSKNFNQSKAINYCATFNIKYAATFTKAKINKDSLDGKERTFIGYYNRYPLFDFPDLNMIYLLEDDLYKPFKEYNPKFKVLVVHNSLFCYKYSKDLILQVSDSIYKFSLDFKFSHVAADDSICFISIKTTNEIVKIRGNYIEKTGLFGSVICLDSSYLYFSKEHDPNLMQANADIYRIDLSTMKISEKIIVNVSGESTLIIPGGKYIFDEKNISGKFMPVLYNITERNYKVLDIDLNNYPLPYFSFQKKCLVLYNSNNSKSNCISYLK